MNKQRFYKIRKFKPITDLKEHKVVHLVTYNDNPIYLGTFLAKDISVYDAQKHYVILNNERKLMNVELCG